MSRRTIVCSWSKKLAHRIIGVFNFTEKKHNFKGYVCIYVITIDYSCLLYKELHITQYQTLKPKPLNQSLNFLDIVFVFHAQ